jgi:hypothetical protein
MPEVYHRPVLDFILLEQQDALDATLPYHPHLADVPADARAKSR